MGGREIKTLILVISLITSPAFAKEQCSPKQGNLALTFAQVRARLAIAAGQCMGYASDVDPQQFASFLKRHKEWTVKGDEWSGAEILRRDGAKGAARTVGANYYATLIFQEQENSRQSSNAKYCGEALEHYKKWVKLDAEALKKQLAETACAKENLEIAVSPVTTTGAPTPIGN